MRPVSSPRLSSSSAALSTATPSSFLFNLFSPLTPSSVRLVHCFISAPGPSSLPPALELPAALPSQQRLWPLPLLASPPPSGRGASGLQESPGKMREERRLQAAWRNPGGAGKPALPPPPLLPSSRLVPGGARIAGLRAGVGCHFVIFLPKERSVGEGVGEKHKRPRQLGNSSVGCGVSVPLTQRPACPRSSSSARGQGDRWGEREVAHR